MREMREVSEKTTPVVDPTLTERVRKVWADATVRRAGSDTSTPWILSRAGMSAIRLGMTREEAATTIDNLLMARARL